MMNSALSTILLTAIHVTSCGLVDPFLPLIPLTNGVVKNTVKRVPNVFGMVKYAPEVGQEQVATVSVKYAIHAALQNPSAFITDEIQLPKIDVTIPNFGRLMMNDGKVQGLLTYTYDPLKSSSVPGEKLKISTKLHFKDLRVTYNETFIVPLGIKTINYGQLKLKFPFNRLHIQFSVVKYYDVLDSVIKSECLCFLTDLQVTQLRDPQVVLSRGTGVHNRLASKVLGHMEDAVTQQVNYAAVRYAQDKLPERGSWLCKDQRLAVAVNRRENESPALETVQKIVARPQKQ